MRIVLKPAGTLILLSILAVLCFLAFNNAELLFGARAEAGSRPSGPAAPAGPAVATTTMRFRPLDLTRLGKTDWVQYGSAPTSSADSVTSGERAVRKKGGGRRIGALEFVGATPAEYEGDPRAFRWTDGAEIASAAESRTGLRMDGVGNGFRFIVTPEIGKRHTLKVWTGGTQVRSKLMARMSDGSPLSSMDESVTSVGNGEFRSLYTIVFQASKPGQTLIASYLVAAGAEGGGVSLQAAALE